MSSNYNKEDLQLILSPSSNNMTRESKNNPKLETQSYPKSNHSADSYLSHILSWQRHIMQAPKTEESRLKDLHPYTRSLTLNDLESCVVLENRAYKDSRDCVSREKLEYRLSKCGEICLGLFCTVVPGSDFQAETLTTSFPIETGRENGAVSVLLGHVISSKTSYSTVTLQSMSVPENWQSQNATSSSLGHQRDGRNVVLHSVAVLPNFQYRGIGKTLVMSLIHQVIGSGISDRLTLLAHEDMVAWFEKRNFKRLGPSAIEFGSGMWIDMIYEVSQTEVATAEGDEETEDEGKEEQREIQREDIKAAASAAEMEVEVQAEIEKPANGSP